MRDLIAVAHYLGGCYEEERVGLLTVVQGGKMRQHMYVETGEFSLVVKKIFSL